MLDGIHSNLIHSCLAKSLRLCPCVGGTFGPCQPNKEQHSSVIYSRDTPVFNQSVLSQVTAGSTRDTEKKASQDEVVPTLCHSAVPGTFSPK